MALPPASSGPPSTNLNLHAVKKEPDIRISADGKTAIMEFGGDEWEVTIEDLDTSATGSDKHLTINQEIARRVHSCFIAVIKESGLNTTDVAEISLSGRATKDQATRKVTKIDIDTVETLTEQADASDPTKKTMKRTSVTVNSAAKKALETLGTALVTHDAALHAPAPLRRPSSAYSTSSGSHPAAASSPAQGASTAPIPPHPPSAPAKIDPLQTQFKDRSTRTFTDPARMIQDQLYGRQGTPDEAKQLKSAIADYVAGTSLFSQKKAEFEDGPGFDMILEDLQHIRKVNLTVLNASADKRTTGIRGTKVFSPGRLDQLLNKTASSLSADEKKELVQLYAQYLRDDGKGMGPGFYSIFTKFSRDTTTAPSEFHVTKQIVILKEEGGKIGILRALPNGEAISPDHRIYLLREGNDTKGYTYKLYDSKADTTNGKNLKALKDITSLDPYDDPVAATTPTQGTSPASLPRPATASSSINAYYDLGTEGRGRCADLCLADQLLRRKGNTNPSETDRVAKADELRGLAITTISITTFINNPNNRKFIRESMEGVIRSGSLPTQRIASSLTAIKASVPDTDNIEDEIINALKRLSSECPRYKGVFDRVDATSTTENEDPFEALKFYIYQAAKSDSTFTTSDANFGQTVIDQVNDSSHPEYKRYIQTALQTLIERANNETARTEGLRNSAASTGTSPTAQEIELAKIYADLLSRNERESSSDIATLAAIAQAQTSIIDHGREFKIVIVGENLGGTDAADHPYKVRQIISSDPTERDITSFSKDDLFIFLKPREGHYYSFGRDDATYNALTI